MRGEDAIYTVNTRCTWETPPHAWGRRSVFLWQFFPFGNTPTCVGKTPYPKCPEWRREKHPHMRGEDMPISVISTATPETPPHAWGRPLTPSFLLRHQKKHPHMRGEDATPRAVISFGKETPPHAWGRRHIPGIFLAYIRNTPTCVGKTHPTEVGKRTAWKHPHMRGEDQVQMIQQLSDAETPPHAWGRRLYGTIEGLFCRNTPTCVGKTLNDH